MSILSSLFGSKKRAKKPSSPTNTSQTQKARASSPTNRPSPTRFLSIRRKSSPNQTAQVHRRDSSDAERRSKVGKEWELPTLEFAGEGRETSRGKSVLGLDDVGRIPSLSEEEIVSLSHVRLSVEEVAKAWTILGSILRSTDHPGCILEQPSPEQAQQYHGTLCLLLLALRPAETSILPTITSHYPSPVSDNPSAIWSDRLLEFARAAPARIPAAALKWTLRRLLPTSLPSSAKSLISPEDYVKFVQAEHAASYPLNAYHSILSTRLDPPVTKLLHEMFDVWAALTAHSEDGSGLGGKIALVLGWWIVQPEMGENSTWEELYEAWRLAGRRAEHLYLAWIRYQSTMHTLPTRLLALVEKYPYGPSDYSAKTLPLPPPCSFDRRTLHLFLRCDRPLKETVLDPLTLLKEAISAKAEDDADDMEVWNSLKAAGRSEGQDRAIHALLNDDSASYLVRFGARDLQKGHITPPQPSRQQSLFEGRAEPVPLARTASNAKLLDALADEVGQMAQSHATTSSKIAPTPTSRTGIPKSASTWDDFTKSGFGEDRESNLNLALTPSPTFVSTSSPVRTPPSSRLNGNTTPATSKKATFEAAARFTIAKEEIIDIDDMFIHTAEEALMERSSSSAWPPFVIARLRNPISPELSEDVIERLLITVTYRPPPVPPTPIAQSPELALPRSVSPSAESTFRFGSFGFKRSASRPGFKPTLFGSSRSVSRDDKGSDFITEPDTIYKKAAARNSDSIGGVDEMGQKVFLAPAPPLPSQPSDTRTLPHVPPKSEEPASTSPSISQAMVVPSAAGNPTVSASKASVTSVTSPVEASPQSRGPNPSDLRPPVGVCGETSPSDWSYGAEGGAHVVFPYLGSPGPYTGRLLRLRKISNHRGDPRPDTSAVWRDELLPRLLPSDLMVSGSGIELESEWLHSVLHVAEDARAIERKKGGSLLQQFGDTPRVTIMENLRLAGGSQEGQKVMAVEIKPKWAFLPSAGTICPPEAANIKSNISRYTLHSHFRGKSSPSHNAYDPLDLYSGDRARVKRSIGGLLEVWRESGGEANSFRVFVDGRIVHPDEADLIPGSETGETLSDVLDSILGPLLERSQVLSILRSLQHQLDPTDISDIARRFQETLPNVPLFDESIVTDITSQELSDFIDTYLSDRSAGSNSPGWTLRQRIIAYSLSAVFKDCSIIIRAVLTPKQDGGWSLGENSAVKVLDLDLKPLKMKYWAELDEKIWRHWLETKWLPDSTESARVQSDTESAMLAAAEPTRKETLADVTVLPGLFPFPMVHTPALGTERAFPGGFPGMPDVPATPGTGMDMSDALDITPVGLSRREQIDSDQNLTSYEHRRHDGSDPMTAKAEDASPPAFNISHSTESVDGAGDGASSQYSSAMSTPLVPGAFKFPEVPTIPAKHVEPEEEVLSEAIEIQRSDSARPTAEPSITTSTVPSVISQPAAIADKAGIPESFFTMTNAQSDIEALARSNPVEPEPSASPIESRFERSLAPSPSPGLPADSKPAAPMEKIILSSPTFGQLPVEALSPLVSPSSEGHTALSLDREPHTITQNGLAPPDEGTQAAHSSSNNLFRSNVSTSEPNATPPSAQSTHDEPKLAYDGLHRPGAPGNEHQNRPAPIALGLPV